MIQEIYAMTNSDTINESVTYDKPFDVGLKHIMFFYLPN